MNITESNVDISVVVPVYNSEDCLEELVVKLKNVLEKANKTYEIVMVNDGSSDGSWRKIIELSPYFNVKGINLKKNYGQDNAIMAGISNSAGNLIVIMDDDLQHDPNDIPELIGKIEEGYDVCYAKFITKKQSFIKNIGSWFNGKIANIVINKPDCIYLSPFKIIRKAIIKDILKYDGPYPYVDGLIFGITNKITQICVDHHPRFVGKGNYGIMRSIGVWARLATNFSIAPLRISALLGFIMSSLSFFLAVLFIVLYFMGNPAPSGWVSMIVIVLFLGGVQMLMLGLLGEYIGRIALYTNRKPQFSIDEIIQGNKKK